MSEIITLKALCAELKTVPREARELLRAAIKDEKANPLLASDHKPRGAWQWVKGSQGEKEVRAILTKK